MYIILSSAFFFFKLSEEFSLAMYIYYLTDPPSILYSELLSTIFLENVDLVQS